MKCKHDNSRPPDDPCAVCREEQEQEQEQGPFRVLRVDIAPIRVDLHVHITGDSAQAAGEFVANLRRWIEEHPGVLTGITFGGV